MGDRFKVRHYNAGLYAETKKSMFSEKRIEDSRWPDVDNLATGLEKLYNDFDEEGYDVVNVVPLQSGSADNWTSGRVPGGYVSFSITRSVLVVGRRRN